MNVRQRKIVAILSAVALAAIGTFLLVRFVQGAEDRALRGEETSNILVAAEAIPRGTPADQLAGKVRTELVPNKVKAEGAVSSLANLSGQVARVDLVKGSQLITSHFAAASNVRDLDVPPGMQQVTISVDAVRSLGGEIRKGDKVGVVVSFDDDGGRTSHFILHKVLVTGVRSNGAVLDTSLSDVAPTGPLSVTLALDAPSVERVVFAAEFGRVWLSAEPDNASTAGTRAQTRGSVLG